MGAESIGIALRVAGYLVFVPIAWHVGNQFCRLFLRLSDSAPTPQKQPRLGIKAGRYIGLLERILIIIGLVMGTWEVIIAVVALKTVARYNELDDQTTAEYFLIGSLASILWAIIVTGLLLGYDAVLGFDSLGSLSSFREQVTAPQGSGD